MPFPLTRTIVEAQRVIADRPAVEPNLRLNPLRLYGSASPASAYRVAREVGDLAHVGYTHKAIDLGEGDSRTYILGWVKRLYQPSIIVTRRTDDLLPAGRVRWLYEVWYVRPETLYQTVTARGWGFDLTDYGRKLQWALYGKTYPLLAWRYGSTVLFDPHWSYVCRYCGREDYIQPAWERNQWEDKVALAEKGVCFECNHFLDTCAKLPQHRVVIVDGTHYFIEPDETGPARFLGHGGRAFRIRFEKGGVPSGVELTTHNLWCQGAIPAALREQFPDRFADNAVFVTEQGEVSS